MVKARILKKAGAVMLILVPPLLFFGMFFRYMVDVPINDDYMAILDFLNNWIGAEPLAAKAELLFSQHNEHRIVYDRIITLAFYFIGIPVNFFWLALIGNLSLVGIFLIFLKQLRRINSNLLYVVPLGVLCFNLGFYENITFAMASLSNFTVYLFSLLSIHFITKTKINRNDVIFSLVFLILAVFTQAGGLFLIPVTILVLLYRRQRPLLFWHAIVCAMVVTAYFYSYKAFVAPDTDIVYDAANPVIFLFAVLGNAWNYFLVFQNPKVSLNATIAIGVVLLLAYGYILKSGYYKKNLFVVSVLTLMLFTAFGITIGRSQLGMDSAVASRYRICSAIFTIGLFIWFVQEVAARRKWIAIAIVPVTLFYFTVPNFRLYQHLDYRQKEVLNGVLHYQSGDYSHLYGFSPNSHRATLEKSAENNIYHLPSFESLESYFHYSKLHTFAAAPRDSGLQSVEKPTVSKIKDGFLIESWEEAKGHYQGGNIYIGLQNGDEPMLFYTTSPIPRYKRSSFVLTDGGFRARLRESDLRPGDSKIWIFRDGKNPELAITQQSIQK
jgi:hypothetical protein